MPGEGGRSTPCRPLVNRSNSALSARPKQASVAAARRPSSSTAASDGHGDRRDTGDRYLPNSAAPRLPTLLAMLKGELSQNSLEPGQVVASARRRRAGRTERRACGGYRRRPLQPDPRPASPGSRRNRPIAYGSFTVSTGASRNGANRRVSTPAGDLRAPSGLITRIWCTGGVPRVRSRVASHERNVRSRSSEGVGSARRYPTSSSPTSRGGRGADRTCGAPARSSSASPPGEPARSSCPMAALLGGPGA